jgi:hypothetical protein
MKRIVLSFYLFAVACIAGCPLPEKDRSPCSADASCASNLCDISGVCSNTCESAYDCVRGEQCRQGVCRLPCDDEPTACDQSSDLYGSPSTCEFHCDERQANGACAHGMSLCVMAGDDSGGSE